MRNLSQQKIIDTSKQLEKKNLELKQNITTDINILLNRVKLDEKKDLKKKLISLSLLFTVISLVVIFAIV